MRAERAWQTLGATDPYFAVLTDASFRERDAFFRSGENDIARVFSDICACVCPDFAPRSALDFGCGVGRLILPLAQRVPRVVGVDVSPAMLQEAQRNTVQRGLANVELLCSSDAGYQLAGGFDFIDSLMVFQHIPVRTGMAIVRDLLGHLNPGGVGALHFVYAIDKPATWRFAFWARHAIPGVHALVNVLRGHPSNRPPMQMNAYPLPPLLSAVREAGCDSATLRFIDHNPFRGAVLMFRRPS